MFCQAWIRQSGQPQPCLTGHHCWSLDESLAPGDSWVTQTPTTHPIDLILILDSRPLTEAQSLCIPLLMSSSVGNYWGLAQTSVWRLQTPTADEAWCWLRAICNCNSLSQLYFLCFTLLVLPRLPCTCPGDGLCRQTLSVVPQWETEACLTLHMWCFLAWRRLQMTPHRLDISLFFCHGNTQVWVLSTFHPYFISTNSIFDESAVSIWGREEFVVQIWSSTQESHLWQKPCLKHISH
jgi:hypothetical protein